jgi:outer membrane biogenesis lipoprotein LolB
MNHNTEAMVVCIRRSGMLLPLNVIELWVIGRSSAGRETSCRKAIRVTS